MTDDIYRERARLVAFVSSLYPSHIRHDTKEPEWPIVCIHTPEGQLTWHISKNDMEFFEHLKTNEMCIWDNHTTEEKYERLYRLGLRWKSLPSEVLEYISQIL